MNSNQMLVTFDEYEDKAGFKNIFVQTYIIYISLPVQAEKPPAIQN